MDDPFLLALALFFVLEGLLPLFFPKLWKSVFLQIAALREGQIRTMGLFAFVLGLLMLFVFYPQ